MTSETPRPADPDSDLRVLEAVEEALGQPASERQAWLRANHGDDPEFLQRVQTLLALAPPTGELSVPPIVGVPEDTPETEAALQPGDRLGEYEIEKEIGRGGMGVVYLAHRTDASFELDVAIKTIVTPERTDIARRFESERRILATLKHPSIAHVLDGGTTPEGLPYLVMELVDGEPLDQYCDRRRLPLRKRLQLLAQVCDGVEHAHRNLVVHRDLKPGNILVTQDGHVKLLDFGIASILGEDGMALVSTTTRSSGGPLTPAYASPEQIRQEPITTLSDVYSLGVLLFELLTGERPGSAVFDTSSDARTPSARVAKRAADAASDLVAEKRSTTTPKLVRSLRGDLDKIAGTALRKDPAERYRSAGALGDDLRLYLAGEPVRARRLTFRYLAGRFVRRHAALVAVVAMAVLVLVAAGIVTVYQSLRAAEEAERRARMNDFLETLLTTADPVHGLSREAKLADLVDYAVERLDSDFPDDPGVRGSLRRTLAGAYLNLGLPETARLLYDQALAEHVEAYGPEHPETLETEWRVAGHDEVVGEFEAALERLDRLLAVLGDRPDEEHLRGLALGNRGAVLSNLGRIEESLESLREATATLQRDEKLAYDLWTTQNNLAVAQIGAGRPAEAIDTLRDALERIEADRDEPFPLKARMHTNLGLAYREQGSLDEAERHLARGARQMVDLLGADHSETLLSRIALSEVLRSLERLEEADQEMSSVVESATATLPPDHYILAYAQTTYAQVLLALGDGERAEPLARAALASRRSSLPEGHWLIASSETSLAKALLQQGRRDEAVEILRSAYPVLLEARGPDFAKTLEARSLLAEAGAAPDP